ncbi:hypothetical protein DSM107133_02490 [Pseudosulfitobacter sp. DSM 107133]|nr:hypothetical protein DSM107133_02490 [Pseudosulfitobacter sp. DSM 107133]
MFDAIPSREGWQAPKNGQPVGRLKLQDSLTERPCLT